MNVETVLAFFQRKEVFYALLVLLVALIAFLVVGNVRKNKLKKIFNDKEVYYNELRSVPILFKLNKANGLAKINKEVIDHVDGCKQEYSEIQDLMSQLASMLAETEDAIVDRKLKKAKESFEDIDSIFTVLDERIHTLDDRLDALLEQEAQQRLLITDYKEEFRQLKFTYQQKEQTLSLAAQVMEQSIKDIEHHFSTFEEWMFATEFEKAKDTSGSARKEMDLFKQRLDQLPEQIAKAKGVVPSLVNEVSSMYHQASDQEVYLQHLEVDKQLTFITDLMKENLTLLKQGAVGKTSEQLSEMEQRLLQLKDQINREVAATNDINQLSVKLFTQVSQLGATLHRLEKDMPVNQARFNFPGFEEKVAKGLQQHADITGVQVKIDRMMKEEKIPASTILIALNELQQDTSLLQRDVDALLDQINEANSDETRAKKQVLKLHLILNDIQIRIKKHHLPSISEKYEDDLRHSYQYIKSIQALLDETVLNVKLLNATVNEAIDYIYRLHNNVNNLIGVVNMVENAIVYANKFRSSYPDINEDLNRAELSFRNGEYTQSLSTIIAAIDRHQPGVSHEDFIKENAQSA